MRWCMVLGTGCEVRGVTGECEKGDEGNGRMEWCEMLTRGRRDSGMTGEG